MLEKNLWNVLVSLLRDNRRLWAEMVKDKSKIDSNLDDLIANLEVALATARAIRKERQDDIY